MVLGSLSRTAQQANVSNKSWSLWAAQACARVTWSWRLISSLYRDSHTLRWWSCSRSVLLELRPAWWFREVGQVRKVAAGRDGVEDSWLSRTPLVLPHLFVYLFAYSSISSFTVVAKCVYVFQSKEAETCSMLNSDWLMHSYSQVPFFVLFSLLNIISLLDCNTVDASPLCSLSHTTWWSTNVFRLIEKCLPFAVLSYSISRIWFFFIMSVSYISFPEPQVKATKLRQIKSSTVFPQRTGTLQMVKCFLPCVFRTCGPLTVIIMHCTLSWVTHRVVICRINR